MIIALRLLVLVVVLLVGAALVRRWQEDGVTFPECVTCPNREGQPAYPPPGPPPKSDR